MRFTYLLFALACFAIAFGLYAIITPAGIPLISNLVSPAATLAAGGAGLMFLWYMINPAAAKRDDDSLT